MRVLFVDDDALLRRLGEYALGKVGGMSVDTVQDGPAALAAVEKVIPDAILLDYMMPGMDGDEVLAILQSSPATREIPVVFLTALEDEEVREALLAAGAAGCLSKPFDPMLLAHELRAVLVSSAGSDTATP